MITVATGWRYVDIDGYAGCIAYAELLRLQGHEARAVLTAPLNESITPTIRDWDADYETTYTPTDDDNFVLVDISEAEFFDRFVTEDRVVEIYDHHPGFEAYWRERIGDKAVIEEVGAACTQIAEAWEAAGLLDKMPEHTAGMLMSGILDNTLNFGAKITKDRDRRMYEKLLSISGLPQNWDEVYFRECEASIMVDAVDAVMRDHKEIDFATYPAARLNVGQLTLWRAASVLDDERVLQAVLAAYDAVAPNGWFINLISLADRCSYIVATKPEMQQWLSGLLGVTFDGPVAQADRLWLRKEIIGADLSR